MVYREPPTPTPIRVITYGPFPLRTSRLIGALALFVVAAPLIWAGLDMQRLTCNRSDGLCELVRWPTRGSESFRVADLEGAHVQLTVGRKHPRGAVILETTSGDYALLDEPLPAARKGAADLGDFLAHSHEPQVTIAVHTMREALPPAGLLVVLGIAFFGSAVQGAGRYRLRVDRDAGAIEVARSAFGIPLGRRRRLELGTITRVLVEWHPLPEPKLMAPGGEPEQGGFLAFATPRGHVRLTEKTLRGLKVHLRAAIELCEALELPESRRALEQRLVPAPPALSLWDRLGYCLVGAICGAPVGIFAFVAVGSPSGVTFFSGLATGALAGIGLALHQTRANRPVR
jgi:hypothetical protein